MQTFVPSSSSPRFTPKAAKSSSAAPCSNDSLDTVERRIADANAAAVHHPHRLLRLPEVEERVRIKRNSIYRHIKTGAFPRPIKMNGASFWIESEIDGYIESLIAARNLASRS